MPATNHTPVMEDVGSETICGLRSARLGAPPIKTLLLHAVRNRTRIPSTIQNRTYPHDIRFNFVIDGEGEPLREQPMVASEMHLVYTGKKPQRVDIGEQGVEEVGTQPVRLALVESVTGYEGSC
jgi:hypothetical protein